MNVYLCGSNRNNNCYSLLKDLKTDSDILITLKDTNIKYCLGCNCCVEKLDNYCVMTDGMSDIYPKLLQADKIIIASPIYFNQITGLLKNLIDRLNPFSCHGLLSGKKIYLLTIGAIDEEENKEVSINIENYFKELAEIFEFDFGYLRNFTSNQNDDIKSNYDNYDSIIWDLKAKI